MKYDKFAALIRLYTGTDADTFKEADLMLLANVSKDAIAGEIKKINEGYFGVYSYRDLVAGQREYSLPSDLLATIERAEIKIDGTHWKPMNEISLPLTQTATDETSVLAAFTGKDPVYDIFRGSLIIYSGVPIIDVPQGLKLWSYEFPQDMIAENEDLDLSTPRTDTDAGLPREFHELLARRVSIAWKGSQDQPIALTDSEINYEKDLSNALLTIRGANQDRAIGVQFTQDDGESY